MWLQLRIPPWRRQLISPEQDPPASRPRRGRRPPAVRPDGTDSRAGGSATAGEMEVPRPAGRGACRTSRPPDACLTERISRHHPLAPGPARATAVGTSHVKPHEHAVGTDDHEVPRPAGRGARGQPPGWWVRSRDSIHLAEDQSPPSRCRVYSSRGAEMDLIGRDRAKLGSVASSCLDGVVRRSPNVAAADPSRPSLPVGVPHACRWPHRAIICRWARRAINRAIICLWPRGDDDEPGVGIAESVRYNDPKISF